MHPAEEKLTDGDRRESPTAETMSSSKYEHSLYEVKRRSAMFLVDLAEPSASRGTICALLDVLVRTFRRTLLFSRQPEVGLAWTADPENPVVVGTDRTHSPVGAVKALESLADRVGGEKFAATRSVPFHRVFTRCAKAMPTDRASAHLVIVTDVPDPSGEDNLVMGIKRALASSGTTVWLVPVKGSPAPGRFLCELVDAQGPTFDPDDTAPLVRFLTELTQPRTQIRRHYLRLTPHHKLGLWVQTWRAHKQYKLLKNARVSHKTKRICRRNYKIPQTFKARPNRYGLDRMRDRRSKKEMYGFQLRRVADAVPIAPHRHTGPHMTVEVIEEEESGRFDRAMFNALWEYCTDKNKALICWYRYPGYRSRRWEYVLRPQQNLRRRFVATRVVRTRQVKRWPSNHVRKSAVEGRPSDEATDCVSQLVDKLSMTYSTDRLVCRRHERRAACIKAALLNEEMPNNKDVPDFVNINDVEEVVGNELVQRFIKAFSLQPNCIGPPKKKARKV